MNWGRDGQTICTLLGSGQDEEKRILHLKIFEAYKKCRIQEEEENQWDRESYIAQILYSNLGILNCTAVTTKIVEMRVQFSSLHWKEAKCDQRVVLFEMKKECMALIHISKSTELQLIMITHLSAGGTINWNYRWLQYLAPVQLEKTYMTKIIILVVIK